MGKNDVLTCIVLDEYNDTQTCFLLNGVLISNIATIRKLSYFMQMIDWHFDYLSEGLDVYSSISHYVITGDESWLKQLTN